MIERWQMKVIYALGNNLGLNKNSHEDELHQLVCGITGKESVKLLTKGEADQVIEELKKRTDTMPVNEHGMTNKQKSYIQRLMKELATYDPADCDIEKRLYGLLSKTLKKPINKRSLLKGLTKADGIKIIETLKRYVDTAKKKRKAAGDADG